MRTDYRRPKQGDQMSVGKSGPKSGPNNFFAKINPQLVPWKKVAQKCALLLQFFKPLPKVNNHPLGENSPNLVTLVPSVFCEFYQGHIIQGANLSRA
jgi:hypothetical protein